MRNGGILVKLRTPPRGKLAIGRGEGRPERLFSAPAGDEGARDQGMGTAAGGEAAWYSVVPVKDTFAAASAHPWDTAHLALSPGLGIESDQVLAVEPDLEQSWLPPPRLGGLAAAAATCDPAPQKGGAYELGEHFAWHLDEAHSRLGAARVPAGGGSGITIVHLDTGYDAGHGALPAGLDHARERSYVDTGNQPFRTGSGSAVDPGMPGLLHNIGHGTGTIGLLAGGKADALTVAGEFGDHLGEIGGAPAARVVPVRIADSVVKLWTSTVAQGIDYARELGADVLSMSMGGLPSQAWADAVNAAYDAGVVLVTAAGNSFAGLPTSLIVYPARFNRVIAACGVMAKGSPYYGLGGPMEGCVGPATKMMTAMAAYTPNVPWLRWGCKDVVDLDGNGTSSATPQIAAAAALWLAQNGQGFAQRDAFRVEAVRAALFGSARRPDDAAQYFGQGILDAVEALKRVPTRGGLRPVAPDSASFAFLKLLTGALGAAPQEPVRTGMYALEITQLALNSVGFRDAVPEPDADPAGIPETARRAAMSAILDEGLCSQALRAYLGRVLGRRGAVVPSALPPAPPPAPPPGLPPGLPPANGAGVQGQGVRPSSAVPREIQIPAPTRRQLRIFAIDPLASARLDTSMLNIAKVEVPWEELQPGPVGEYLEVVDVDPTSGVAYPPIDLDQRHLLAQAGYAPSEGNPQFHQQAVYAVAMRTIRNFEIALGRRALWAERIPAKKAGTYPPMPDRGFVRRLRVYPHALRQANAFYSPDKKALLFGYYGATQGPSRGRQVVFTCLSHDIVAHETTHALLDGLHRRFREDTTPDALAFHEAFADIVAVFQHFTFPELLRHELSKLGGDLTQQSILSDLARQFGQSLHNKRALRQAIPPGRRQREDSEELREPELNYRDVTEAHDRGAVLLAAMFEAFTSIYARRTQPLIRLAGASGSLVKGAIHPDLVDQLAMVAVDVAQRVLTTAIRALDYMPPVDPTFGDYLRAVVTADADQEPNHGVGYRVAFAEAFARRGIYPDDVPSVSPDGLLWQASVGPIQSSRLDDFLRALDISSYNHTDRRKAFEGAKANAAALHDWLSANLDHATAESIGLDFNLVHPKSGLPLFEVHSVRPALRTTEDGERRTDIVAVITQSKRIQLPTGGSIKIYGGCTLLLDRSHGPPPIRYAIIRTIDPKRIAERVSYAAQASMGLDRVYPAKAKGGENEPFAALHLGLGEDWSGGGHEH